LGKLRGEKERVVKKGWGREGGKGGMKVWEGERRVGREDEEKWGGRGRKKKRGEGKRQVRRL